MNPRQALEDVRSIRVALNAAQGWCFLRSASIGLSGIVGLVAGGFQPLLLDASSSNPIRFVIFWGAVAVLNLLIVFFELSVRERRSQSLLLQSQSRTVISQFLPSLCIGAIATIAIIARSSELVILLPGMWCLFFSLGIFASLRHLPTMLGWIALYYAFVGSLLCVFANPEMVTGGWAVGTSFGVGQLLSAVVIWRKTGDVFH